MIRYFKKQDIDRIMELWLYTNISAHYFVDSEYWTSNYNTVKDMLPDAIIYVYEENNFIQGFIGLMDNYIAGVFVSQQLQSKGIGKKLLDYVKDKKEVLSLSVYKENYRAVNFYLRENFTIINEQIDKNTGKIELNMNWKFMNKLQYKFPNLREAEIILNEANELNPGQWVEHSKYVAEAAKLIASHDKDLDKDIAYVLGLLHDIGRRYGRHYIRHSIDGYKYAMEKGYDFLARVSITHSFLCYKIDDICGEMDLTETEYDFIKNYLGNIEYTSYDKLIQLCDVLALPVGFCLIEKRMVDVVMRYGFSDFTLEKWKVTFQIKEYFEERIGTSIYNILPNVVENTFMLDQD